MTLALTTLAIGYLAGRLHRWRRVHAQIGAAWSGGRAFEREEIRRVLTEVVEAGDEAMEMAERAEYVGERANG